ncbi:methyl-CpG-binding domain-containing protein 10-like [Salvia hispanica]|uniref:methyl-CpG-binding domain-containing protein 10-like n=1 Tax=Salvia hispanica TaxID=49212 RepID=UPI002009434C|nr:methyl-CpG-binding domain-containing protein 10-like [Salvia hispanica]
MATEEANHHNDVVPADLPAPSGWSKKFAPKKSGTPQRNDVVFVSPTGEEIKSKRQLEQYLKSHPGGPSASEFVWSKGDTPRRSARLSEKSKEVAAAPTSQSPKKKQKRSATKAAVEKSNADAEEDEATGEKDATAEEAKDPLEEDTIPGSEDAQKKPDTEESPAGVEDPNNTSNTVVQEPKADESKEAPDAKNNGAEDAASGGKDTLDAVLDTAPDAEVAKVDTEVGLSDTKEKEADEKEEVVLKEPTTGS